VADDDAEVGRAEGAGGFDEFALAGGENLGADQARVADPSAEREREHEIERCRGRGKATKAMASRIPGNERKAFITTTLTKRSMAPAVVSGDGEPTMSAEGERGRQHYEQPTMSMEMRAP
jgi:hypothetical protein